MKKPWHTGMRLVACLLSGYIFVGPIYGQKAPDINKILPLFIERAEKDSEHVLDNYTHEELETTHNVKNGVVTEIETTKYLAERRGPLIYKKLLSINDIEMPDSKFKLKKETISINARLFQRYIFELKGSGVINGEKCWILFFKPKVNFPEEEKRDRVLNNLSGEAWVTQDSLTFKKLVTHLAREVDFYSPNLGFGLKAKKIEGIVESSLLDGHSAITKIKVEFQYSARAFGWPINKHGIITILYQNYERRKP